MATVAQVSTIVTDVQEGSVVALGLLSSVDPALAVPDAIVAQLLTMASKSLAAYSAAAGVPITAESVAVLMVPTDPLDKPTS